MKKKKKKKRESNKMERKELFFLIKEHTSTQDLWERRRGKVIANGVQKEFRYFLTKPTTREEKWKMKKKPSLLKLVMEESAEGPPGTPGGRGFLSDMFQKVDPD